MSQLMAYTVNAAFAEPCQVSAADLAPDQPGAVIHLGGDILAPPLSRPRYRWTGIGQLMTDDGAAYRSKRCPCVGPGQSKM